MIGSVLKARYDRGRVNSRCSGQTFPGIRDSVKELIGKQTDALARKFNETHDMKVKDEIERLLKEYGRLKLPWEFVSR
jgi:hypothetical protein